MRSLATRHRRARLAVAVLLPALALLSGGGVGLADPPVEPGVAPAFVLRPALSNLAAGSSASVETGSVLGTAPVSFTCQWQQAGSGATPGAWADVGTGLYHLRARQYDSANGRFLTTDPVPPEVSDPYVGAYVYVNAQPTVLVDPTGETAVLDDMLLSRDMAVWVYQQTKREASRCDAVRGRAGAQRIGGPCRGAST